jgi:hypothetical protein
VVKRALVLALVAGCNVPAVDYILTDASRPSTRFRQGVDGYVGTLDTNIDAVNDVSRGGEIFLEWSTNNSRHALLRFDGIFDRLGPSVTLDDAILVLRVTAPGSPSGMLYEIIRDWDESTTYQTFGPNQGVQAGEDRAAQQIGIVDGSVPGTTSINVSASISRWKANPALNKGWVLVPADASTVAVASSEGPSEEDRPMLIVYYTE